NNAIGSMDLFITAKLPTNRLNQGDMIYRRKGGGAVGFNYHVNEALSLSLGYSYTDAELEHDNSKKSLHQHVAGVGASYDTNDWYNAITAGLYKDFVPSARSETAMDRFFDSTAYGVTAMVARKFR